MNSTKETMEAWAATTIRQLIDENSGGLKITELVTHLAERIFQGTLENAGTLLQEIVDNIETIIDGIPELSILEYAGPNDRLKMFVYRRL